MSIRTYPADRTALILVDLLNDFFADDGKLNGLITPDAVAEFTEAAQRAAVDLSYPTFGHSVTTVDGFLAGIEPATAA